MLEVLPKFRSLKYLELIAECCLDSEERDSESTDPDYDNAGIIMRKLYAGKIGAPFERINVNLRGSSPPWNWTPLVKFSKKVRGKLCCCYSLTEISWCHNRIFASRIDDNGEYQQEVMHGSERVEDSLSQSLSQEPQQSTDTESSNSVESIGT